MLYLRLFLGRYYWQWTCRVNVPTFQHYGCSLWFFCLCELLMIKTWQRVGKKCNVSSDSHSYSSYGHLYGLFCSFADNRGYLCRECRRMESFVCCCIHRNNCHACCGDHVWAVGIFSNVDPFDLVKGELRLGIVAYILITARYIFSRFPYYLVTFYPSITENLDLILLLGWGLVLLFTAILAVAFGTGTKASQTSWGSSWLLLSFCRFGRAWIDRTGWKTDVLQWKMVFSTNRHSGCQKVQFLLFFLRGPINRLGKILFIYL